MYATVQDLRDEGITEAQATDARLLALIEEATATIDRITGWFFEPREMTVYMDGRGTPSIEPPYPPIELVELIREKLESPSGGFYDTAHDPRARGGLRRRNRSILENSVMAEALLRLGDHALHHVTVSRRQAAMGRDRGPRALLDGAVAVSATPGPAHRRPGRPVRRAGGALQHSTWPTGRVPSEK